MNTAESIVATIAASSLLLCSPLKAASLDEQSALVAKVEEQMKQLEKLPPQEFDKALRILDIEDPSIRKAIAHHRSLTEETEAALTFLQKTHSAILDNTRAKLVVAKRELENAKASK